MYTLWLLLPRPFCDIHKRDCGRVADNLVARHGMVSGKVGQAGFDSERKCAALKLAARLDVFAPVSVASFVTKLKPFDPLCHCSESRKFSRSIDPELLLQARRRGGVLKHQ